MSSFRRQMMGSRIGNQIDDNSASEVLDQTRPDYNETSTIKNKSVDRGSGQLGLNSIENYVFKGIPNVIATRYQNDTILKQN